MNLYKIDEYFEISSKMQSRWEFEEKINGVLDEIFLERYTDLKGSFVTTHSLSRTFNDH